jgi:uncharacterized SAM-binding protein YcdF (DUF218 family)
MDVVFVIGAAFVEPNLKKVDAIVVMGAAINSPELYSRSLKALELYEQSLAPVVVLTGGRISDKDISEAAYAKKVMEKNSKGPVNVLLEDSSTNTYENMQNARKLLPEAKSIIVVTDSYHSARSVFMGLSVGFKEVLWAASENTAKPRTTIYHYFREIVALPSYVPKFLGN